MLQSVEPKVDYLTTVKEVLEKEAYAILELHDSVGQSIENAIDLILECKGRLIITGIGKSGIIGRKINATMASTGTPSLFLHPAEGLHGDLGMVTSDDLLLAISNSGESDEVLQMLPSIKKIGAKIISITKKPYSTLALKSDIVLSIGNVQEACPLGLAPTSSTTVTLALGDALAIALLEARGFKKEDFALFHPAGSLGRKLLLTVNDVIEDTKHNPVVFETATVKEALFQMTAQGLGGVSVINKEGKLIGILTDGDIRRALAKSNTVFDMDVAELLNPKPISIQQGALAEEAVQLMEKNEVNVLPVVDLANRPIAMVQVRDLMTLGV
ncbi:KpsF/GutQ family sugar-phosphate isomerase [Bacillus timonensis]|uniref:KpsF/GutQ family sugar-phosphate isomerase n=1 Tax=Bacillus timonensis TaxID=1033734 RepID=A0A4S3PND9_9BACI|nr:KpsF/GutQ family sugar-phosphate isomerase [Bacillus timonensis]THE11029.1 KpsF/GutQ family sugar-phosphate isomerase [Bacillus timonensis]